MEKSEELVNLNVVRAALIILIVLYHSALFWTGTWFPLPTLQTAYFLGYFAQWLDSFHIYCFVFLSGYLFYYQRRELNKYDNFTRFVKNKFFRLLIPYIFVSLCWNIPFDLYFNGGNLYNCILSYGLGTAPEQLWFLLMLFGVFVMFYLFEKSSFFYNKGTPSFLSFLICFLCFFVGISGWFFIPNYLQIWRIFMFVFFFYLGYVARNGVLYKYLKTDTPSLIGYALLQVILFMLVKSLDIPNAFFLKLYRLSVGYICHILGAFVAFNVLIKWCSFSTIVDKSKFLSTNSFGIYLFHQQIIYIGLFLMVNKFNPYLITGISFLGAYLISLVLTVILSKNSYTKPIIGLKSRS